MNMPRAVGSAGAVAIDPQGAERMTTVPPSTTSPQLTCIECGEPLALEFSERQMCDRCYAAFRAYMTDYMADQERQRHERREREAWAEECGIPQPGNVTSLILNGSSFGEDWQDYTIESIGLREHPTDWPPPWPFYQLGPLVSRVYARRIHLRNTPIYLDWRLSSDGEPTISLRGLEHGSVTLDHVRRAYRGRLLLRTSSNQRGRRTGSGQYRTMQEFHAAYFKAMDGFRSEDTKPTAELIADSLCLSKSRYYELLNQWPL
jgi:hypothetical protein